MILNPELNTAYLALLNKAQAYQICASVDRAVDCRKLQSELVMLYKFKEQGNELEVAARVARLDKFLEDRISHLKDDIKVSIVKFQADKNVDTWISSKLEEILAKVNEISLSATPGEAPNKQDILGYLCRNIEIIPKGEEEEETPEPKKRGRRTSTTGKVVRILKFMEELPPMEEVTGRQVTERMGYREKDMKAVSDTLRHLYNKKLIKRRLTHNQYRYWREA
jgi:hypothetical protein